MNLYLLKRVQEQERHDQAYGFVVAARTALGARSLVVTSKLCGDESAGEWFSRELSTCVRIGTASPGTREGVLLRDFLGG